MKPAIDDAALAEIRRLWNKGVTPWAIGERFGLSPAEVREARDPARLARARRESKAAEALAKESAKVSARVAGDSARVAREAARLDALRVAASARLARRAERGAARLADRKARLAQLEAEAAARIARERAEARRRGKAADRKAAREAARDEEIRRLWSSGMTGRALATRFGMVPSKVSGIVPGLPRPVRYADPETIPILPPLPKPAVLPEMPPDPADRLVPEATVRGSEHGRASLDEAKVAEMRRLRAAGWSTGRLAVRYGVARNTICYAVAGRTWRHVVEGLEPMGGGG